MTACLSYLQTSKYFAGLNTPELKRVADLALEKTLAPGDLLTEECEAENCVFLILTGRADVSVSLAGSSEVEIIATVSAGDLVGEMALLGNRRRSASVRARSKLSVLAWEGKDLLDLFDRDQRIGYAVTRNVAGDIATRLADSNLLLRNALTDHRSMIL